MSKIREQEEAGHGREVALQGTEGGGGKSAGHRRAPNSAKKIELEDEGTKHLKQIFNRSALLCRKSSLGCSKETQWEGRLELGGY